jgi:SAM-dependent methyltransferase
VSAPHAKGWGPGKQSADGCSVELYRVLPYAGELEQVIHLFLAGTVLELGCGTGRLCRRLLEHGLTVTGVDNSAEMLSSIPAGVTGVFADIESLSLGCRFDNVLLASHLINHEDDDVARHFLEAAARHVNPTGRVFVQRFDPGWLKNTSAGYAADIQGITFAVDSVQRSHDLVSMTLRYEHDSDTWLHAFRARALDEASVEKLLARAGLVNVEWHGSRRTWATSQLN